MYDETLSIGAPYGSRRSPIMARNMVASSHPLAAQAGLRAMDRGGNAIDAAVAAAITISVVEPTMNGIGGDGFSLVWDGTQLHGLVGSGKSPHGWTRDRFAGRNGMPKYGWESVTVPGGVSQWVALSKRFGQLPFADLFEDAIRIIHDGFAVSPVLAHWWHIAGEELKGQPGFAEAFLPGGRAPRYGETWRYADQAKTLTDIAMTNGESFYRGRLASAIADAARQNGAVLCERDLEEHEASWVTPISQGYKGYEMHEIPPSGQGLTALIALGLLERFNLEEAPRNSATRMHLQIEAMRAAFADAHAYIADPAHMPVSASDLLDPAYLDARARLIDPAKAGTYAPGQPPRGGTTYLCTADKEGRMVSLIQSNFKHFGSGVVVPGTGIAMHNRGWGFVLEEGHPNDVGPAKRPYHTIIPGFLTKGGKPVMAFGVMGGLMQPQGHVQVALRTILDGENPQTALDAPRFRIGDDGRLMLESEVPADVVEQLVAMGHKPIVTSPGAGIIEYGSGQIIARLSDDLNGGYVAGSDWRRDGQAVGF
ncbi:gamma-glutamyltransferase family protein [Maritimibacter alkaliphilus]|uniref:gamma-glutamyltransferase family protein n=1 Tax=Maritimibacter alkaliphilus TaxID=404236 RepID=UPI001C95547F|nr:gamma-glutamyltransferase family protein [Maritimibacter alkaliphilus]MBY6092644.1 gamma-glutamyltransferase family protein [Maritimibacter alkaliphilus]